MMQNNINAITDIKFISIKEADAEQLHILDSLCFSVPWSKTAFEEEKSNGLAEYVIAVYDGEYIGYMGFHCVAGEASVTNICVAPSWRRKGLGELLMTKCIGLAKEKGAERMLLEVRNQNIPALRLYEKFGFYRTGLRKNYYSSPSDDAVLMDKIL